jgi:ferritin-like metal-binding protein YciE
VGDRRQADAASTAGGVTGKLASPRDLFLQLLAQTLWVERTLVFEVLPQMRKQVQSESLAAALDEHLAQTHEHVARVETAFHALGAEPVSARSAPAAALKGEHEELAAKVAEPRLADLFHVGAAVQTEHVELAGYELLLELAQVLDRDEIAQSLAANRADEAQTLERLREIAERLREELRAAGAATGFGATPAG